MRSIHALVGLSVGVCASVAAATPLNLVLQDTPDILSGFISTAYIAETDVFTAAGFALNIDFPPVLRGAPVPITNGTFDIFAIIDSSGSASVGTLEIRGVISDETRGEAPLLLSGSLVSFGFPDPVARGAAGGVLEFLFDVTGGSLAGLYGSQAGVILGDSGYPGFWTETWRNDGNAESDTAPPVPAPFSAVGLLAGAGLVGLRRRR